MNQITVKPPRQKLTIIGNGMAADRLLECLCAAQHNYDICVIGEEPYAAYNRISLSSVLAGDKSSSKIQLKDSGWYTKNRIEIICGDPARNVDLETQSIGLESGQCLSFDKLVFATGSRAFVPRIPGNQSAAVRCFRNMEDVNYLLEQARKITRVAIIGGGLLGLEAAHGMNLAGLEVEVVHRQPYLMNRQLDSRAGQILQSQLEGRGIKFHLNRSPKAIQECSESQTGYKTELVLDNGQCLKADLVIFAAGISPNKELADECGIACGRAIQVDEYMQTSSENVFAIGECAEYQGRTIGLVVPAKQQAEVLASNLLGKERTYSHKEVSTRLKVSGIELFSAGQIDSLPDEPVKSLNVEDARFGIYRKLNIQNNRLCGAVLLGDKRSGNWYENLIEEKTNLSEFGPQLIFGRDYCESNSDQHLETIEVTP